MEAEVLRAMQHYKARAAIGSSSMRGASSAGGVERARVFLGQMDLRPLGTANRSKFLSHLDKLIDRVKSVRTRSGLARQPGVPNHPL